MKIIPLAIGAALLSAIGGHAVVAGTTTAHATTCVPVHAGPNGPRWGLGQGGVGGSLPDHLEALTYNQYGVQLDGTSIMPSTRTFLCSIPSTGGAITSIVARVADRNEAADMDVVCTATISSLVDGSPIWTATTGTSGWDNANQILFFSPSPPVDGSVSFSCTVPRQSAAHGFSNLGHFAVTRL